MDPLTSALARFKPIALAEMDNVALLARMDTKYVFAAALLPRVLEGLGADYRVLEVDGTVGTTYRTLYFDTPARSFYYKHHNGNPFRSKVRMREYADTQARFLEVKQRTGRGGTVKRRIPVEAIAEQLTPAQAAFASSSGVDGAALVPMLRNAFTRYTLVHGERQERLTLDLGLRFRDEGGQAALPAVCVAELKEGRTGHGSPFAALMRKHRVPPAPFSKYCIGTVLLQPGIKYNQFKPVLLRVQRLAQQHSPTAPLP